MNVKCPKCEKNAYLKHHGQATKTLIGGGAGGYAGWTAGAPEELKSRPRPVPFPVRLALWQEQQSGSSPLWAPSAADDNPGREEILVIF